MEFLKSKGFSNFEINKITERYNSDILYNFSFNSDNVSEVIDYFVEYGIKNIPKLMLERIDVFLVAVENLKEIFSHYEKEYIIRVLDEDSSIFDELE